MTRGLRLARGGWLPALALLAAMPVAMAQQIRGTPQAVMNPQGLQSPPASLPFTGQTMPRPVDSPPAWPAQNKPPARAPNVLPILTDDAGFAAPSIFGGVMPALGSVAQDGLRGTISRPAAPRSPRRAPLSTAHSHHAAGFGPVSELPMGFPGCNSIIPRDTGTILRGDGDAPAWFARNHHVPPGEASAAGALTHGPGGMGSDCCHGFIGGDTWPWQPGSLFRNTTPPPDPGMDGGPPVDDRDHQPPVAVTGRIGRITVDLGAGRMTPEAVRNFGALLAARAAEGHAPTPAAAIPAAPAPARR